MSFALLALVALTSLICAPRHAEARNELMVKIMTLLFDNEFVKIDSDRGQVSLLLMFGLDTGFRFAYMQEGEVSTCITTYVASGSKVSYADLSCDGAPERKRIGEGPIQTELSGSDVGEFTTILTKLSVFAPAITEYRKFKPAPTATMENMTRGFGFLEPNRQLIIGILNDISNSSITVYNDHPSHSDRWIKVIQFVGHAHSLALFAEADRDFYHSCHIVEETPNEKRTHIDLGCNGSVDYGAVGSEDPHHIDAILNAESYNSLLQDLDRFTEAARKVFPKK